MEFEKKVHGTVLSYNNGCRCDLCKKAKSDYRKNGKISGHGTKWYYDKGCRCDSCREAKNIYKRKITGAQPRKINTKVVTETKKIGKIVYAVTSTTRICFYCKKEKPLEEFGKNKHSSFGYTYDCKVCKNARSRNNKNTPGHRFSTYNSGAKTRKIDFNLSYEEFMSFWKKPCYYCGTEIDGIGLDRKDPKIGYNINNVVPCCSQCNRAKTIQTTDQFISMCLKVAKKFENHIVPPGTAKPVT